MRFTLFIPVLALSACAPKSAAVPPAKLTAPAATLMQRPAGLPALAEGESVYEHAAVCRAEYGRLSTQVVGLQNWATIVTKRKATLQ